MNSAISLKTDDAIEKMRISGQLAARVLEMIEPHIQAGVTTNQINQLCHDYIVNVQSAIPAPLNYHGFPKSICTSVNHVVCHGIPDDIPLKDGDVINVDVTVIKNGYHGDTSCMFFVGSVPEKIKHLCRVTQECLYLGIEQVCPGKTLGDIGFVIAQHAHKYGYSVVEEYCGHGIGEIFHEPPQVLHFGQPNTGVILRPGMCFTIEPMINKGKKGVKLLEDKWTVVTKDRQSSAQWEHTLLVTKNGCEILTKRSNETNPLH